MHGRDEHTTESCGHLWTHAMEIERFVHHNLALVGVMNDEETLPAYHICLSCMRTYSRLRRLELMGIASLLCVRAH